MKNSEVRAGLAAALQEVTAAEGALGKLLGELAVAPRAEKITVTNVIEAAFSRLRSARSELAKISDLVEKD